MDRIYYMTEKSCLKYTHIYYVHITSIFIYVHTETYTKIYTIYFSEMN